MFIQIYVSILKLQIYRWLIYIIIFLRLYGKVQNTFKMADPKVLSLFNEFNKKYFWGKLDKVKVTWSPRMTL